MIKIRNLLNYFVFFFSFKMKVKKNNNNYKFIKKFDLYMIQGKLNFDIYIVVIFF